MKTYSLGDLGELAQLCECGTPGARVMKDFPGRPLCGPCYGAAWNLKVQVSEIERSEP